MSDRRKRIYGRKRIKRTPFKLNLNPGADVVLAEAATEASKASTPKDLSKVHGRIANASTSAASAVSAALPGIINAADKVTERLNDYEKES